MYIPSYEDLTPSIPDVSVQETFAQVARLLPADDSTRVPVTPGTAPAAEPASGAAPLFACLRSPRTPEIIASVARDFSPRIERHGTTAVMLDVSGLGRLLGDAQAIGAELDRAAAARASGVRVAIARTQTAARLLAIARPGLTVVTGEVAASIAALSITVLGQLMDEVHAPGSEDAKRTGRMLDTLRRWGLRTLGEIASLPSIGLSQRMGEAGLALQRIACGLDRAPLVPDPGVPRFIETLELEWPIDALEPLSFVLPRLLDPLSAALERADRAAAAIRLDLRLTDRTTHARVLQLPAAMRDARVLRTLLLLDLESHPPSAGIDVVSIEIDPAPSRIIQYSLLERATPSAETMATLMARLRALVGETRCGTPVLLDTHRPDGFQMGVKGTGTAFRTNAQESGASPLNAQESGASPLLRRFRPAVAIRVTVERGRPVHVAIDRRGMPGGRVEQHAGPWRTSGAWWDAAGTHWDRDEWDVAFAGGTLCRLFRERTTGSWFLEGLLD
jgi:protein ImuB